MPFFCFCFCFLCFRFFKVMSLLKPKSHLDFSASSKGPKKTPNSTQTLSLPFLKFRKTSTLQLELVQVRHKDLVWRFALGSNLSLLLLQLQTISDQPKPQTFTPFVLYTIILIHLSLKSTPLRGTTGTNGCTRPNWKTQKIQHLALPHHLILTQLGKMRQHCNCQS